MVIHYPVFEAAQQQQYPPVMNRLTQENARCLDTGLVGGEKLTPAGEIGRHVASGERT